MKEKAFFTQSGHRLERVEDAPGGGPLQQRRRAVKRAEAAEGARATQAWQALPRSFILKTLGDTRILREGRTWQICA